MNTANKIENHIRAIFGNTDTSTNDLLIHLYNKIFMDVSLNSANNLNASNILQKNEDIQKAMFPENIEKQMKLHFNSCAISFYISTSPPENLTGIQTEIRNTIFSIKDCILDSQEILKTTMFGLNTLLHYCRIIDRNDDKLTLKRDLIKGMILELKQLDKQPTNRLLMTKQFELEPIKLDISPTTQQKILQNILERNKATAPFELIQGEDINDIFAGKSVTLKIQIFRSDLDEFTDALIKDYEGKNNDVFDNFDRLKEFITKQIDQSHKAQYSCVLQGKGTNKFTQLSTRRTPPTIDAITSRATIRDEDFTVVIEKYNDLAAGLRVSTHKLLDALTIQLTKQNDYRGTGEINKAVSISLEEFMNLCDTPLTKPSMDKTRRTVKEDLEALYNVSLEWKECCGKKINDYTKMRVISSQGIRNSQIIAGFSPEIAQYLTHAYVMQYPNALFTLDERNEAAYILGRYLAVHASIDNNHTKGTSDIISVKSLLDACNKVIPSYNDVSETDRHFERRIINPLEKALDSLQDRSIIKNWYYCNSKKAPLTEAQLKAFNYEIFKDLYVYFEMKNPPDQTLRIQAKALRVVKKHYPRKKKTSFHQK